MEEDTSAAGIDSLSLALMKMKLRALVNVALDAGGEWAIDFPPLHGVSLNVVQRGECWLSFADHDQRVRLQAGDCFLLTDGTAFSLAHSASPKKEKRLRIEQLFAHAQNGVVTCQGGGDSLVLGTIFRFEGDLWKIVFGRLPPVIRVAADSDQASVLRWSFERFADELRGAAIGRSLMLNQLAPIMLLQMLRIYLLSEAGDDNWFMALSDPRLSKALEAIHIEYQREWSLATLAGRAGMSRSAFALAFKRKVGVAPMDYLASWRMQIARELLQGGDEPLAAVAGSVGYASESAFSAAFYKIAQCRPGAYRMQQRASVSPSQPSVLHPSDISAT